MSSQQTKRPIYFEPAAVVFVCLRGGLGRFFSSGFDTVRGTISARKTAIE